MSSEWQPSDLPEPSYGDSVDSNTEFDTPESRSYDWEKRANEIKERDEYVCQRCDDHNGNYEQYPLVMEAHHIVPGKYLPTSDARVDLNLVTVCGTCHGYLERAHVKHQLAEIGRDDALRVLTFLEGRERTVRTISRELEFSAEHVQTVVSQLERMNCVTSVGRTGYRTICLAVSKSAAERATWHMKREQRHRDALETTLDDRRQDLLSELDELESTLEAGDRARLESAVDRLRNALSA